MSFLVDTSVLVEYGMDDSADDWSVSLITIGELQAGVLLATDPQTRAKRLRDLTALKDEAEVVGIDQNVASAYAEIRAAAGRQPANDLWIAATASAHDLVLVTADKRMAKLPGLRTHLVS